MSSQVWILMEVVDTETGERNCFIGAFSSFENALKISRELWSADIGTVKWRQSYNNPSYFEGYSDPNHHYVAWRQEVDTI